MNNIKDLIITPQDKTAPLSKKAIQFNKLLIRIQKAEAKIVETKNKLDQKFIEFNQKVLPVHHERCIIHLEILKEILAYISDNKISNTREEILRSFCIVTVEQIGMGPHGFTEEKFEEFKSVMKKIYPELDTSDEEFADEDDSVFDIDERAAALEMTKDMIRAQFGMMGIDIDLDHITIEMTDDEIKEALDKKIGEVDPDYQQYGKKEKKKSKAQLRKEASKKEFNDMKEKSFSSMYKNLVKLIHPDGEQNDQLKEKKSEWMKRLTVAYKNKDLKTMMLIELEWLHGSKDELEKMSEEKMSYFIEMLKEQATELDHQNALLYADPRYQSMAFFTQNPYQLNYFKPTAFSKLLIEETNKDKEMLANLQRSPASARKQILAIIESTRDDMSHDVFGWDF